MYAVVRKDAQTKLFSVIGNYSLAHMLIVEPLVAMLERCRDGSGEPLTHEQLKGCLYVIRGKGTGRDSLMVKQNWRIMRSVWPALFRCQNFEKPSIQALLDKLFSNANRDHDSFDNRVLFSERAIRTACAMLGNIDSDEHKQLRLELFARRCERENRLVGELIGEIVHLSRLSHLSWKNQATGFNSILFMLNACKLERRLLTADWIQLLVDSLVHENISIRRV